MAPRAHHRPMRRLVFLALLLATPAVAQAPTPAARKAELDKMLGALKDAPTETAAAELEAHIRDAWLQFGSPAATLLMGRGLRNLQANAGDEAVDDFSAVLALEPDLAEAYDRRALAYFELGDYASAFHDIGETLKREPRNFAALQGLSRIAEARGDWKGALAAWEKSLELDPKTPGGVERLKLLRRKAQGEES
jgi:tetratricopeptide (TPR) repeat protein